MAADETNDVIENTTKLVEALVKAEPVIDVIMLITIFLFVYFIINIFLNFFKESKEAALISACNAVLRDVKSLLGEVSEQLRRL